MTRPKRLNGDTPSIIDGVKLCSACEVMLPVESFHKRTLKTGNISLRSKCKECEKKANKTATRRAQLSAIHSKYAKANRDKVNAIRRKYQASAKGKAAKKRDDAAYAASGGRAKTEARRLAKPLSVARAAAKLKNQTQRRAGKVYDELSLFVLSEAYKLAKERGVIVGGRWEVDHINPVALGGTNKYDNIQVVPKRWNRQKSHLRVERFLGAS